MARRDAPTSTTSAESAAIGRIPIRFIAPAQPEQRWPAKAFAGEVVPFRATIFKEGHDTLAAEVELTDPTGSVSCHELRMPVPGTDRWFADVRLDAVGDWRFRVRAWVDPWHTWLQTADTKLRAGQDVELVFAGGAALLRRAGRARVTLDAASVLVDTALTAAERWGVVQDPAVRAAMAARAPRELVTESAEHVVRVERERAGVGAWYEFFPRSEGAQRLEDGSWRSGTFASAAARLPAIAAMGFDVVYLPPIHPIGTTHRKGPNNSLKAGPHDPGSPWAIGSAAGGHDAIHPDLGTVGDFTAFLGTAAEHRLEVALDLALQCSPDHPWVTEHPEWFTRRPDGSIAFAENPPKQYQDIYPLNFDNDPEGIRAEVLRIVEHWIGLGVRIFRVDNPHTKPLDFWEWLLRAVRERHPDVVFLAEAFTRPAMLRSLAGVGFQQSYTYFTWRNTKRELEDYLSELAHETADYLRPNLFVNTPDILTEYLQHGGEPAYRVRAAIAATAAPIWGVYSGYELIENVARPGSEENIDNEKYEYKPRDWTSAEQRGESLAPYLAQLNGIRAAHPTLHQLRNFSAHWSDDDAVLVYSKHLDAAHDASGHGDTIIVVANLDPHSTRETTVHLDVTKLGLPLDSRFTAHDLLTGERYNWGADNYVRLDPQSTPVHILHVDPPARSERNVGTALRESAQRLGTREMQGARTGSSAPPRGANPSKPGGRLRGDGS